MENKLLHDIRTCNSKLHRPPPTNGTAPLNVTLNLSITQFKFNSELQEFSMSMFFILRWVDERLKWDPKKYDGLKSVLTTTNDVWAPGIKLINEIEDNYRYLYLPCELKFEGAVFCIAWIDYKAKCAADLKDWPYDTPFCNLEFGTHHEIATKVQLDFSGRPLSLIDPEPGTEWDIIGYNHSLDKNSEKQLIMTFKLVRHAEILATMVIYPLLVLNILTFSALFIDARLNLRLLVIFFSLMDHFYFLTDLKWKLPDNTKDPPRLLLYYRGSFILTNILIAMTYVLRFIYSKEVVCPSWIISINNFVFANRFVKLAIWPRWESENNSDISTKNSAKDWIDFANIINSICIIVSVFVYVSLYCVLMPHPIPYSGKTSLY